MKVLKSALLGLCFGVKRATALALEARRNSRGPVYTLGPLIHNPQEVERLDRLGITARSSIEQCRGGKTLLRTHGITAGQLRRARELRIDLVDAVCPRVKAVRRYIQRFASQGYRVILVGDAGHPEVEALCSFARQATVVVDSPEGLPKLAADEPVAVLAQTTQAPEVYQAVVQACREKYRLVEAVCSICRDAGERQAEGLRLAAVVDLLLVVGGRNSANTTRLAAICRRRQPRTYHIETAAELEEIDFTGVEVVGLASGASTPDWLIAQVEQWLHQQPAGPSRLRKEA